MLPDGPQALASWANVWGSGAIVDDLAHIWTDSLLRPFFKASVTAEPARPVACSEALLKFALGCVFQSQR